VRAWYTQRVISTKLKMAREGVEYWFFWYVPPQHRATTVRTPQFLHEEQTFRVVTELVHSVSVTEVSLLTYSSFCPFFLLSEEIQRIDCFNMHTLLYTLLSQSSCGCFHSNQ